MRKKLGVIILFNIIIISFLSVIYAETKVNDMPTFAVVESVNSSEETKEVVKSVEAKTVSANADFNFKSKSQILMEMSTGKVIYENNADEKSYPASVTKIMTVLLIMEAIDSSKISYNDKVTCSENAAAMGGSQIWFKVGEQLTIDEALKCICVVSANDVCVAMAEMIGGNEENFVKMMNNKAKELGMNGTNFTNAHGIDDPNHYTTARDIAIMSRELMTKHPDVIKYTTIWMDSIRGGTFQLSNTNKLIRYYEGATGLKTGFTSTAMYNLSATATKNNMSLVAVVLTAPSSEVRNEEAKQLLNYGFANYEIQKLCDKEQIIDSIKVNKNLKGNIDVVLEDNINILNEKGKKIEYDKQVNIGKEFKAPLKKGDIVGNVVYKDKEGNEIGTVNIVTKEEVSKSGVIDYLKYALKIYGVNIEMF